MIREAKLTLLHGAHSFRSVPFRIVLLWMSVCSVFDRVDIRFKEMYKGTTTLIKLRYNFIDPSSTYWS